jgi:hypothetical protein
MAFTTGMSKEGKKLMNSTDERIHSDMDDLISPEDKIILQNNIKREKEKMMKQLKKNGALYFLKRIPNTLFFCR